MNDLAKLIDERPIGGYQILTFMLCGSAAILDGMDSQSIGIAATSIAASLNISMKSFAPIFSAALLGAAIGALVVGSLADRLGRKRALIGAVLIFGLFTLLTPHATTYNQLLVVRFLAGIGLGGATPCFLALVSEYAPSRQRQTLVSVLWAGYAVGSMVGGLLNSYVIAHFQWRVIFYLGGLVPVVLVFVMAFALPESLKYLVARGDAQARIRGIVRRLWPDAVDLPDEFTGSKQKLDGISVMQLFSNGRAIPTLLLWVPFFMAFGTLAVVSLWTPPLLRQNGIQPSDAALTIAAHGLGAIIGLASSGPLIARFGLLRILVPALVCGAASTLAIGLSGSSVFLAAFAMGSVGLFVGLGTSGAVVIATTAYPTAIRATGIGWAMGIGRFGQFVGPLWVGSMLAGALTIPVIYQWLAGVPLIAAVFIAIFHFDQKRRGQRANDRPLADVST
jgi:MFS transporter, AAHS family, 4-hydroxybenzoate transporter